MLRGVSIEIESFHSSCRYSYTVQLLASCTESKPPAIPQNPLLAEKDWKRHCWWAGIEQILCCTDILAANAVFTQRPAEMLRGWGQKASSWGKRGAGHRKWKRRNEYQNELKIISVHRWYLLHKKRTELPFTALWVVALHRGRNVTLTGCCCSPDSGIQCLT